MTVYGVPREWSLVVGDCLEVMRSLPEETFDSIVTDPPYGLGFMGKAWDYLPPGEEWAKQCLRLLKPGGHLLAFGGSRTWHRLAVAVEDAGFEIRDSIAWLYGSGFPKSRNLDGDWQGWGTALKPAFEPIVVGRKPFAGTVAANVLEHGTGALNIDACRTATSDKLGGGHSSSGQQMQDGWHRPWMDDPDAVAANAERSRASVARSEELGRWPANVVLDESQAAELDKQTETVIHGAGHAREGSEAVVSSSYEASAYEMGQDRKMPRFGDSGGASRFFPTFRYQAKAPSKERPKVDGVAHPTVKPLELMRWLVRLVTPPDGLVLDPFSGSGTTLEAAVLEGFRAFGIEDHEEYIPLILKRMNHEAS